MTFTLLDAFLEALKHPEFVNTFGWLYAISMMIGAVLNDGWRRLLSWTIAVIVSIALTEGSRYAYWATHSRLDIYLQGTALILLSTTVNLFGLASGWFVVYAAKCRTRGIPIFPIRDLAEHKRRKEDLIDFDTLKGD